MLRGLYTATMGMKDSQAKQDVSANNIANSSTPGYKQDKAVSKAFPEIMLQNRDKEVGGRPVEQELGSMPFGVGVDGIYTDFAQGSFEDTGRDLDFALEGRGLFEIQYFDGIGTGERYTRDGSFKLDSDGMLVTSEGGYVLGRDTSTGDVGPMQIGEGKLTVDKEGNVFVDSVKKYTMQVVDFDDYTSLDKVGNNMYASKDNTAPRILNSDKYEINQGSLEMSNIDMTGEIVNMVSNLRSYQANQRVLQSLNDTLGKAVNEVGSLK